jgi:hypothetical protein
MLPTLTFPETVVRNLAAKDEQERDGAPGQREGLQSVQWWRQQQVRARPSASGATHAGHPSFLPGWWRCSAAERVTSWTHDRVDVVVVALPKHPLGMQEGCCD